jgi:hypothetical protein
MTPLDVALRTNRRTFLQRSGLCLGTAALGTLAAATPRQAVGAETGKDSRPNLPLQPATAKRVVYLFQAGAPSQIELLDYKPKLKDRQKQELPSEVRMGQRLTGMTSGQKSFPIAASLFKFAQHGQNGTWISELLPRTAGIVDDLRIIRSMQTEAINHDPAITFCLTGSQLAGRPSLGAWVAYGLGTLNQDLPTFIVMVSRGLSDQPLYDRLWGSGCLPSRYQGVKIRSGKEPVLYLTNPAGCGRTTRREMLDDIKALNMEQYAETGDSETLPRRTI